MIIGLYISETIMYIAKEHLEQSEEKSIAITLAEHLTLHCTSKFVKKPSYSDRKLFNVLPVDILKERFEGKISKTTLTLWLIV